MAYNSIYGNRNFGDILDAASIFQSVELCGGVGDDVCRIGMCVGCDYQCSSDFDT